MKGEGFESDVGSSRLYPAGRVTITGEVFFMSQGYMMQDFHFPFQLFSHRLTSFVLIPTHFLYSGLSTSQYQKALAATPSSPCQSIERVATKDSRADCCIQPCR
jgi:hypothetical protein